MIIIKGIILILIFIITVFLGINISNKYKERTKELKLFRNILNILGTKIKYTYEPLPQIFEYIHTNFQDNIGKIFKNAKEKMRDTSAGEAWNYAIKTSNTNLNQEDLNIINSLEKLLGKTDVEGQLNEIELMKKFIEIQIGKSEEEQLKNEKLYKNLGIIVGLTLVIILI